MNAWRQVVLIGALAASTAAGCGRREDRTAVEATPGEAPSDTVAAGDTTPAGGGGAGTQGWRVHEEALRSALDEGRLNDVHDHTEALHRALADARREAGGANAHADSVLREAAGLADALHQAGDAGDLTRAKAEFARLRTSLRTLEGLLGASH